MLLNQLESEKANQFSWRSFLRPAIFTYRSPQRKLRSTAYLDGLRGLAAFLVYVSHHIAVSHAFGAPFNVGWGKDGFYSLITTPILRIFFSGSHFAVSIFFVISGFVLSRGPMRLMQMGDQSVGTSLSSAVFRRGIRLWIPVIGTTFVYMLLRHLGLYAAFPILKENLLLEVVAYLKELWSFTYLLRIEENPYLDLKKSTFSYNPHTWTIALEYQGSILLFIVLLAFSHTTIKARMTLMATLAIYFNLQGSWVSFCFLSGSLLAEVDLLDLEVLRKPSQNLTMVLVAILSTALLLGSMPTIELQMMTREYLRSNPGWSMLSNMIPGAYEDIKPYWLSWAAIMLVFSGSYLSWFRRFFESGPLQYLGKLSFAFYLVHGPVLQVVGVRMYHVTGMSYAADGWLAKYNSWVPMPMIGPFGLELPFLVAQLVILPVTFYCAEIVEKCFDAPSVNIAKWCHQSCKASTDKPDGRVTTHR